MVAGRELSAKDVENTARLKWFWAHGRGREKWINSPHPYTTLLHLLEKYVSSHVAHGEAANIFRMATGHFPGQRARGERL